MTTAPPNRTVDAIIAVLLVIVATSVVVATNDMGFVRDEAFYFDHAETYQDWQVRVESGGREAEKALSRKEILATWRNNAEHPPLDKWLFGWSWRALGRKLRPVDHFRMEAQQARVDLTGLGPAHGFAVGSQVDVLSPQLVGNDPSPNGRTIARGEVIDRKPDRAVVRLLFQADADKLQQLCQPAGTRTTGPDSAIRRTGCEAVEQRALYFLSESSALRLPGAFFAGLLVALIYLAGRMTFAGRQTAAGRGTLERPFALLAAVGYLCIPQAFWHAHLCAFDATIATLLFATTVLWHRALSSRPWIWLTALTWGLALLAKHNALFLPIPLIAMWTWTTLAERRWTVRATLDGKLRWLLPVGAAAALLVGALVHPVLGLGLGLTVIAAPQVRAVLPPVPGVFVAMLLIGPAVLVAGWPLLWVDTLDNLLRWIEFHLHHEHYMQVWFGQVLQNPPFPAVYPWGMTVLTWPLPLLAATLVGLVALYGPHRWRLRPAAAEAEVTSPHLFGDTGEPLDSTAEQRSWDRMLLVSALWPMALISMPGTPIFGGTKHWMPAFPFLLLIGARGVQSAWHAIVRGQRAEVARNRPIVLAGAWVLIALLLAPAARATADTYVHGAAYFNELIGGIPGAAQAGMQRQFWGGSTRDGLEHVNAHAPKNASIWFHKSAWGAYVMYQREGWFRRDLRYSGGPEGTAMGFFHHQKDHDDFELGLMRDYHWRAAEFQSHLDGAPILSVYRRPGVMREESDAATGARALGLPAMATPTTVPAAPVAPVLVRPPLVAPRRP